MLSTLRHAAFMAFAVAALPALGQQPAGPPPKVAVAAAFSEDIVEETVFIGRGEAVDKVDLLARVQGYLKDVLVANGARVKAGDVLFRIEPDEFAAVLDARKADLAKAEADLQLAEIELARNAELVRRDATPQSQLDIAEANRAIAAAAVLSAKAGIRQAELDLGYTEIRAPFDGQIGRIAVSVGDLVNASSGALTTLVRTNPIFVTFSISERQLADIRQDALARGEAPAAPPDLPVRVRLANGTLLDEVGQLDFGDNRINPETGTLAVRARFENAQGMLLDGAFVSVRIESAEPVTRTLVPQAAVQRDQRGEFVLIVNDQQMVEQRYIETGDTVETAIIVLDGLQPGEPVIVEGLQRVRPGVPVEAVTAGAGTEG